MTEQQGVVSRAGGKKINGREFFSFSLQDVDDLYRTGFDDSKLEVGQIVKFNFEVDKWGNQVDVKSIKVLDEAQPVSEIMGTAKKSSVPKAGGGSGNVVTRDAYWANKELADIDRQKIISYQAATNIATNIVTAALAAEILSLPTKKAEKFDALLAMVTEVADSLVVTYTGAPERVDGLVLDSREKVVEDKNYGEDVSDE